MHFPDRVRLILFPKIGTSQMAYIYTYYCTFSIFGIFLTSSILVGGKWRIYNIHIIAYSWIFMKINEIPERAISDIYTPFATCPPGGAPIFGTSQMAYIYIYTYYCTFLKIHENAIWTYYICSVLHAPAGGGPWSAHRKWRIYIHIIAFP